MEQKDKNDKIKLIACILHLNYASKLISLYDNDTSLALLELVDGLMDKYKILNDDIKEMDNMAHRILEKSDDGR